MRTIPHMRRTQIPDHKSSGHLQLQLAAVPASSFPGLRKEFLCVINSYGCTFKNSVALWAEVLTLSFRPALSFLFMIFHCCVILFGMVDVIFLFSMTYFAEVLQMNTLFCRKHFKHALNYSVQDITDKTCLIFQPWHDGAILGRLALYKAAHISLCLLNWRYTVYKRNFLLSVLEVKCLLQYLY